MKTKKKSCIYLQRAMYLAPNEIRACCQRFHVKGKLKGDVPLISLNEDRNISFQEVIEAKKDLIQKINNGTDDLCSGCPKLKSDHWEAIEEEKLDYISIENHSRCNMRCTYCSDTYYGGVKPKYNLDYLFENMKDAGPDLHIAWGGGEPTLGKDFESLFEKTTKRFKPRTQRIFTNALKYSTTIQNALDNRLSSITTSIDAGTEDTFRLIRKAHKIEKVLNNLKLYSNNNPDLVTIKYIITEGNYGLNDVEGFVHKCMEYKLNKCNYLISTDFKEEKLQTDKISAAIILYYLLFKNGIYAVTFDDHIFRRIGKIEKKYLQLRDIDAHQERYLQITNDIQLIEDYHLDKELIVWGTGEFSKLVFKNSNLVKTRKIYKIVDGNMNKWGTIFNDHVVESPECIKNSDASIIIASSNFYGEIANQLISMGLSKKRIVPTIML